MEETVEEMVDVVMMDVNIPITKVMGIVMMETTMLVVLMMEVTAAPGLIHHLDGISIALFVNVKRMVEETMEVVIVEEIVMNVAPILKSIIKLRMKHMTIKIMYMAITPKCLEL